MSSTPPSWKVRIQHILESIERCQAHVRGLSEEQLGADARTLDAVAWRLTIIGEAARRIPDEISRRYVEVPWAKMRGMRNHIVHGYDAIDVEIVWEVVTRDLPPLLPHLERILNEASE